MKIVKRKDYSPGWDREGYSYYRKEMKQIIVMIATSRIKKAFSVDFIEIISRP